jgi:hypothetical protein
LEQIREAGKHRFLLETSGTLSPRKNPLLQARDYIGDLKDKIRADGKLVSPIPYLLHPHLFAPLFFKWKVQLVNISRLQCAIGIIGVSSRWN